MWFSRKPKNRRLGREYVLDVKLRSSQVRAARARMAVIALGAVFGAVFGVYLLWRGGQWGLNRLVYENPAFAIEEVDVQTDGVLALEQLKRWTGVRLGQNLLALDLARVKRDLELAPMVQSASVERVLPHTLRVRIVEREPLAQLNVARPRGSGVEMASFQLDSEGYVILPLESRERALAPQPDALPLLSGVNPNDVQPGRRIVSPQVQAALQLLVAFEHSAMAGLVDVKRVDVSDPELLVLTTGQGNEVTFGPAEPDEQLRRWHAVFLAGQRMGKALATLNLAITNNIPVRWLEASAVPPPAPKPLKPFHNKKKHV